MRLLAEKLAEDGQDAISLRKAINRIVTKTIA
jgi:hypothetical protein